MSNYLYIKKSPPLQGTVSLSGSKNAVLVMLASLILTEGVSVLTNVPNLPDVRYMILLLQSLGADVSFDQHTHIVHVDTSSIDKWHVSEQIMNKMRASILVLGPLLARFGKASIALPGGCAIGARPINYHIQNLVKMGANITMNDSYIQAEASSLKPAHIVLEYPSVGTTENILMGAVLTPGKTTIVNAALEPEVLDFIQLLQKMGAHIIINPPASILIQGVSLLNPVQYCVMSDRLEAGALLLAAAITGGEITVQNAPVQSMDLLLLKLQEMGHTITYNTNSITLKACAHPQAVSIRTGPYPGFPTDLQAPFMAVQCVAQGTSLIEETVFENRLLHIPFLQNMGAHIEVAHNRATVQGVARLVGANVRATDIRASCALVLAGLRAEGKTTVSGIHHWQRGYDKLDQKLIMLGAHVSLHDKEKICSSLDIFYRELSS